MGSSRTAEGNQNRKADYFDKQEHKRHVDDVPRIALFDIFRNVFGLAGETIEFSEGKFEFPILLFLKVKTQDVYGRDLIMTEFAADNVTQLNENSIQNNANNDCDQHKENVVERRAPVNVGIIEIGPQNAKAYSACQAQHQGISDIAHRIIFLHKEILLNS